MIEECYLQKAEKGLEVGVFHLVSKAPRKAKKLLKLFSELQLAHLGVFDIFQVLQNVVQDLNVGRFFPVLQFWVCEVRLGHGRKKVKVHGCDDAISGMHTGDMGLRAYVLCEYLL